MSLVDTLATRTESEPASRRSTPVRRALLGILVAAGAVVYVEPAPYDLLLPVLLAVFLMLGWARVPAKAATPITLVMLFVFANLVSLFFAPDVPFASFYVSVTVYLIFSWVFFALILHEDVEGYLGAIWYGWTVAALFAAGTGLASRFGLLAGTEEVLLTSIRIRGLFKDPNVFGPFLIPVAVYWISRCEEDGGAKLLRDGLFVALLTVGVLFSLSRAAWGNLIVTLLAYFCLRLMTARSPRDYFRAAGRYWFMLLVVFAGLFWAASSPEVIEQLAQRAQLQYYDLQYGGRFWLQQQALKLAWEQPLGIGPGMTQVLLPQAPHNVYIMILAENGWLAGLSFFGFLILSLWKGLQFCFRHTPIQREYLVIYAAIVGVLINSLVIDSLHWRHLFLLLGMLWGPLLASPGAWRAAPVPVAAPVRALSRVARPRRLPLAARADLGDSRERDALRLAASRYAPAHSDGVLRGWQRAPELRFRRVPASRRLLLTAGALLGAAWHLLRRAGVAARGAASTAGLAAARALAALARLPVTLLRTAGQALWAGGRASGLAVRRGVTGMAAGGSALARAVARGATSLAAGAQAGAQRAATGLEAGATAGTAGLRRRTGALAAGVAAAGRSATQGLSAAGRHAGAALRGLARDIVVILRTSGRGATQAARATRLASVRAAGRAATAARATGHNLGRLALAPVVLLRAGLRHGAGAAGQAGGALRRSGQATAAAGGTGARHLARLPTRLALALRARAHSAAASAHAAAQRLGRLALAPVVLLRAGLHRGAVAAGQAGGALRRGGHAMAAAAGRMTRQLARLAVLPFRLLRDGVQRTTRAARALGDGLRRGGDRAITAADASGRGLAESLGRGEARLRAGIAASGRRLDGALRAAVRASGRGLGAAGASAGRTAARAVAFAGLGLIRSPARILAAGAGLAARLARSAGIGMRRCAAALARAMTSLFRLPGAAAGALAERRARIRQPAPASGAPERPMPGDTAPAAPANKPATAARHRPASVTWTHRRRPAPAPAIPAEGDSRRRPTLGRPWAALAAVATLLVAGSFLYVTLTRTPGPGRQESAQPTTGERPAPAPLGRAEMAELRRLLVQIDLLDGPAEGVAEGATRQAIRSYQEMAGLPVDGEPSPALLEDLRAVAGMLD